MMGIVLLIALCLIGAYGIKKFSSVSQEGAASNFRISTGA
jgi:flagellar biogenesis protein FliO